MIGNEKPFMSGNHEGENDSELLWWAAKAIGMHIAQGSRIAIDGKLWNPRHDPGDAFRLLVALHLELVPIEGGGWDVGHYPTDDVFPVVLASDYSKDDQLDAACRAIVRAAAEIGRRMP